jgi:hypothetical protein
MSPVRPIRTLVNKWPAAVPVAEAVAVAAAVDVAAAVAYYCYCYYFTICYTHFAAPYLLNQASY